MIEVLEFIFSEWYIFFGVLVILSVIGEIIESIVNTIKDKK